MTIPKNTRNSGTETYVILFDQDEFDPPTAITFAHTHDEALAAMIRVSAATREQVEDLDLDTERDIFVLQDTLNDLTHRHLDVCVYRLEPGVTITL